MRCRLELGLIPEIVRLQRHVAYFGNQRGVDGLLSMIEDEELCILLKELWEDRNTPPLAYAPFKEWREVKDEVFKDLIGGMMHLDPMGRLTAREALEHQWFADVCDLHDTLH